MRSDHSLVDDLTLVRCGKAELPGKVPKLAMSQAHKNWMRIIIIRLALFSVQEAQEKTESRKQKAESATNRKA